MPGVLHAEGFRAYGLGLKVCGFGMKNEAFGPAICSAAGVALPTS